MNNLTKSNVKYSLALSFVSPLFLLANSCVLYKYWEWFITPLFNVKTLPFSSAVCLYVFIQFIFSGVYRMETVNHMTSCEPELTRERMNNSLLVSIVAPNVMMLSGYLWHYFFPITESIFK